MIIEILNIILVFILCCICIYTDYRYGLIYNVVLAVIGLPLIVLNCISIIIDKPEDLAKYVIYIIIAVIICIILYVAKIWAGGDLKLFCVIILGMPISFVLKSVLNISYLYWILLFAFSLGYLYLIGDSIIQMILKKDSILELIKESVKGFINYLKIYVCVLFFNHIINTFVYIVLQNALPTGIQVLINIIFIFFINKLNLLYYKSVLFAFLTADLLLGVFSLKMFTDYRVYITWGLIVFIIMTRSMIKRYNYKKISFHDLNRGMILSLPTSFSLVNEHSIKFNRLSDESLASRLTQEEVDEICRFCKNNEKFKELFIVKKIPFALFLSLATMIVVIGGSYFEFENF